MTARNTIIRRRVLLALAALPLMRGEARAAAKPAITVHKDPNCGCCNGWVAHLRSHDFDVTAIETTALDQVKAKLGVPADLAACHTAEVGGYVVEGHVPAVAVERLLVERPDARGLAVPGMPAGSPGMGGEPEQYEAILFGGSSRRVYGRFKGDRPV
jgi:hypothetical protein